MMRFPTYNPINYARINKQVWDDLLSLNLRELRVALRVGGIPESPEYYREGGREWFAHLERFQNLRTFEVYIPLAKHTPVPDIGNLGCCKLFAMDQQGVPYRDFAYYGRSK